MPTIDIVGVKFYVPDINDLTSFVVNPLTNTIHGVLNTLTDTVNAVRTSTVQAITSQVGAVLGDLASLRTEVAVSLNGVGQSFTQGLVQLEQLSIADYQTYIVGPVQSYVQSLAGQVAALGDDLRNAGQFIVS